MKQRLSERERERENERIDSMKTLCIAKDVVDNEMGHMLKLITKF